jgi:hypothetical protein
MDGVAILNMMAKEAACKSPEVVEWAMWTLVERIFQAVGTASKKTVRATETQSS